MNKLCFIASFIMYFTISVRPVFAVWPSVADTSAVTTFQQLNQDERIHTLKAVLDNYGSPLSDNAKNFVFYADKYQLDWKLVAAIAGAESTFGKHIPTSSFNAWGWGVFTGTQNGAVFTSWEHGIATVSEGLRKNYLDRGAQTIEQIGHNYASSHNWHRSVNFFITKIEEYSPTTSRKLLVEL